MQLSHKYQRQQGAVAVIVAISIVVIVGIVALALDLGKLYVAKSELQNSADACALAAARELTGSSATQLTIAEAAGRKTGQVNSVLFQSESVAAINVTFSDVVNGSYQAAFEGEAAKNMKFARCGTTRAGIANWLAQVLNILPGTTIGPQTVQATAVAGLVNSHTNCAIPIGLCKKDVDALASPKEGRWLEGALSEGITGSFKWIDFSPPAGGAQELADLLKGSGLCNLPSLGAEVGESGFVASLADTWNTRFGVYKNKPTQSGSTPDFTGYAYTDFSSSWPSKFNAYGNFTEKRKINAPYQGDTLTGLNIKGSIDDSATLSASGADRRLAIAPIVDCDGFVSGSTAPITNWACVLMLHPIADNASSTNPVRMYIEYRGLANDPNSPCATLGMPGGSGSVGPQVPTLVK